MKVHKVILMIIDHDGVGDEIKSVIENARYPNRCISPCVMSMESREIGEWDDSLPINIRANAAAEFDKLFKEKPCNQ